MMKQFKVGSAREFDQKLRAWARRWSARSGRSTSELAQQWIGQQIKRDEEITYDQMVVYYRQHQDEFTKPARASGKN